MRVELACTPPFAGDAILAFLAFRAVPGIEEVDGDVYRRVLQIDSATGVLSARIRPGASVIELELDPALAGVADAVTERVRRAFDADADGRAIDEVLAADPLLRPLVSATPGMRLPGAFDGFEIAVRAVVGQQISVVAARTVTARLAARFGDPLAPAVGALRVAFPRPEAMAGAAPEGLGMPTARGATLVAVARAICDGRLDLDAGADPEAAHAALLALPGIGPWTASYVAMRAFGDGDAFPASDLVLRQVLGGTTAASTREAEQLSLRWRPWRAYAVIRLWGASAELRLARGVA
jgi:AraC family transcriptional regulator, regulatory protein of adaptative response / DNA-3-methyladenine glycosylase II